MIGFAGIALWCISFMGLCYCFSKLFRVDAAFVPMVTASSVIVLLMLAGMIGILKIGVMCVYAVGFAGAVYKIVRRERFEKKSVLVIGVCAVWLAFLIVKLRAQTLLASDDFGHWGLVARFLIAGDAFPDAKMELMHFPSYPLGSACFIYYVCRFAENSDRMYLIAQAFLVFIYALPLLAFVKQSRISGCICFLCVFMLLSSAGTFIDRIQVDTLISFMGFSAAVLAFSERKNMYRMLFVCAPVLAAISFVKISGLFFASVCAPIFCCAGLKKNKRAAAAFFCFAPLIAFLSYYLFQAYASIRFPMSGESVHALNLNTYAQRAAERVQMVMPVIKSYVSRVIHASYIEKALFVFPFSASIVSIVLAHKKSDRDGKRQSAALLLYQTAVYALYNLMMIAMYLFSMRVDEANRLASFTRYYRTMLVFIALITAAEYIKRAYHDDKIFLRRWKMRHVISGASVLLTVIAVLLNSRVCGFIRPLESYSYYEKCRTLNQSIDKNQNGRYAVFVSHRKDAPAIDEIQLNMMLLYELNTMDVVCIVQDEENMVYRVYDRRYETEKAGGVFYLLNTVPCETKTYLEFEREIGRYVKPGDTVFMLDADESFIKMITGSTIEEVTILE